jgi:hypothetical protein
MVESVSAEWAVMRELRLLLGSSFVRSPYAELDTQVLLRASYAMDIVPGGSAR